MGTYNLSPIEISDVFEKLQFESHCEGDFTERTFIRGARDYLNKLRRAGAEIPIE